MTDDRLRTADISKKRKFLKAHSGYLSIFSEKFFAELDHFKTKGIVGHIPALLLIEHFEPRIKLPASLEAVSEVRSKALA